MFFVGLLSVVVLQQALQKGLSKIGRMYNVLLLLASEYL